MFIIQNNQRSCKIALLDYKNALKITKLRNNPNHTFIKVVTLSNFLAKSVYPNFRTFLNTKL